MRSDLFANNMEAQGKDTFTKQNSKLLKVTLSGTECMARQGSMVAYQGQASFDFQKQGGIGKALKAKMTGEGVPLMRCGGQAEVFFADRAQDIHLIYLEGDGLSVNGKNILAFDATISYDIQRIGSGGGLGGLAAGVAAGGGLYNTLLQGTGWVAIVSDGPPVVLQTDAPTYVDANAVVGWSHGLSTQLHQSAKLSAGALIGRTSGEAFQVAFGGSGWVIVQPSEYDPMAATAGASGGKGGIGGLLGG
jgi:uncharacterized protein (AIM24 family)